MVQTHASRGTNTKLPLLNLTTSVPIPSAGGGSGIEDGVGGQNTDVFGSEGNLGIPELEVQFQDEGGDMATEPYEDEIRKYMI